ncbi:hypothetical protein D3C83_170520 [compost metagenome]
MERNLAEEIGAELCRRLAGATVTEDVRLLSAMRADEGAHVLDDAEDGHLRALKHGQALARVDEGDVLRRRDDDGAGE